MAKPLDEQYRAISDQVDQIAGKAVAVATLEVLRELKRRTPVDTGHARSNWIPTTGAPHRAVEQGSAGAAQAVGEVAIATGRAAKTFISNNVPYIQRLDQGHSQKAPTGFVRQSVFAGLARARAKIATMLKRVGK